MKFKIGDRVRPVDVSTTINTFKKDKEYIVYGLSRDGKYVYIKGISGSWRLDRFELIEEKSFKIGDEVYHINDEKQKYIINHIDSYGYLGLVDYGKNYNPSFFRHWPQEVKGLDSDSIKAFSSDFRYKPVLNVEALKDSKMNSIKNFPKTAVMYTCSAIWRLVKHQANYWIKEPFLLICFKIMRAVRFVVMSVVMAASVAGGVYTYQNADYVKSEVGKYLPTITIHAPEKSL